MDAEQRASLFAEYARVYAELRWVLLPLDGKEPRHRAWQRTTYAAPELAEGKWSRWGRSANVGVLLGASGLNVVEDDSPEARERLLELCGGELPLTPIAISGGSSTHVYFADAGQGNAARDGLELRAGAQQCGLPPSVHPETHREYRWEEGREPWAIPLAPVPEALLAFFAETTKAKRAAPQAPTGDDQEAVQEPVRSLELGRLRDQLRRGDPSEQADVRVGREQRPRLRAVLEPVPIPGRADQGRER
jgi:hypothetical protein